MSIPNEDPIAEQLRSFVERVERLNEEIAGLNSDKRDVFAEAKAMGFDPKVLKRVIQLRQQDHAERQEFEAILDTYLAALGMADHVDVAAPTLARLHAHTRGEGVGEH